MINLFYVVVAYTSLDLKGAEVKVNILDTFTIAVSTGGIAITPVWKNWNTKTNAWDTTTKAAFVKSTTALKDETTYLGE